MPVKLSDQLVVDARTVADASVRSISGQVEYWARLGRVVDRLLDGGQAIALARQGAAESLSEAMDAVLRGDRADNLQRHLDQQPYPRYRPDPDQAGVLIRTQSDGSESRGRFVHRRFVEID